MDTSHSLRDCGEPIILFRGLLGLNPRAKQLMEPAVPPREFNMATVIGLDSPEGEPPGSPQVKTLQYTRRGLKMVGEEKSLFDLEEPIWHPDEKVLLIMWMLSALYWERGWFVWLQRLRKTEGRGGGSASVGILHLSLIMPIFFTNWPTILGLYSMSTV